MSFLEKVKNKKINNKILFELSDQYDNLSIEDLIDKLDKVATKFAQVIGEQNYKNLMILLHQLNKRYTHDLIQEMISYLDYEDFMYVYGDDVLFATDMELIFEDINDDLL